MAGPGRATTVIAGRLATTMADVSSFVLVGIPEKLFEMYRESDEISLRGRCLAYILIKEQITAGSNMGDLLRWPLGWAEPQAPAMLPPHC